MVFGGGLAEQHEPCGARRLVERTAGLGVDAVVEELEQPTRQLGASVGDRVADDLDERVGVVAVEPLGDEGVFGLGCPGRKNAFF